MKFRITSPRNVTLMLEKCCSPLPPTPPSSSSSSLQLGSLLKKVPFSSSLSPFSGKIFGIKKDYFDVVYVRSINQRKLRRGNVPIIFGLICKPSRVIREKICKNEKRVVFSTQKILLVLVFFELKESKKLSGKNNVLEIF